jgi:hypothetical protein
MKDLWLLEFHCHGDITHDEGQQIRSILEECWVT